MKNIDKFIDRFTVAIIILFMILLNIVLIFEIVNRINPPIKKPQQCQVPIITSEPYTIVYHQPYSDKILEACQKDENCIDIMLLEDLITRDEYQEFISQID